MNTAVLGISGQPWGLWGWGGGDDEITERETHAVAFPQDAQTSYTQIKDKKVSPVLEPKMKC